MEYREHNETAIHSNRITANLFYATDSISCFKLFIIQLD